MTLNLPYFFSFYRMFGMVIDRVLIADLQKVSGEIERKITAVGISNILIDCPAMLQSPYNAFYPRLLAGLIEFFELPHDETQLPEDQQVLDHDDVSGYQAAYSQLLFARNPRKDPLACKFIHYFWLVGKTTQLHFSWFRENRVLRLQSCVNTYRAEINALKYL